MRRNGMVVGAGDAAFLMRRFGRGGGSQVRVVQLVVILGTFSRPEESVLSSMPCSNTGGPGMVQSYEKECRKYVFTR